MSFFSDDVPTSPLGKGRKFSKLEFARRFSISRTVQIQHTSSLQYGWLHELATTLSEKGEVVMLAAGPRGRDPLRFQLNGTPYRAFLEGRIDGDKYKLLMHLSNMQLKRDGGGATPQFKK